MCAVLLIFLCADVVSAANVEGVRLWRSPDSTRIVFDLDGPAEHTIFKLDKPSRLVIDIRRTTFSASLDKLELDNTPVERLRYGAQANGDLRVVLDLSAEINPRSFSLKSIDDKPDRLVIDLHDKEEQVVKTVESIIRETQLSAKRDVLIAIDAGHGGEDPGAVGPGRLYEKDVVLKVAKTLESLINKEPGFKAVLTRTGDYYIGLSERPEAARKTQADFFVSIHADGFDNPSAKGASVYTLSRRGASSKMASILASKENKSDLIGGVERIQLGDKEDQLRQILVDLSMTRSMETSIEIGRRVLGEMSKVAHLHINRVESAGFAVLKSADMPSILVETGFITNPSEAKNLNSSQYRDRLAKAIFAGIKAHFSEKPPEGTLLAWKRNGGNQLAYTIVSGDTLSSIAQRYQVSVAQIIQENNLSSSKIRVGQTLVIP